MMKSHSDISSDFPETWMQGLLRLSKRGDCSNVHAAALADARRGYGQGWFPIFADFGWDVLDLFGVHPLTFERLDCQGIFILLRGAEIVQVTQDYVLISRRDVSEIKAFLLAGGVLDIHPQYGVLGFGEGINRVARGLKGQGAIPIWDMKG